jgi:hypothetical protein
MPFGLFQPSNVMSLLNMLIFLNHGEDKVLHGEVQRLCDLFVFLLPALVVQKMSNNNNDDVTFANYTTIILAILPNKILHLLHCFAIFHYQVKTKPFLSFVQTISQVKNHIHCNYKSPLKNYGNMSLKWFDFIRFSGRFPVHLLTLKFT